MFEVDIYYIDEKGYRTQVDLVFVHNRAEAQKRCDELSSQLGIELMLGAMIFID